MTTASTDEPKIVGKKPTLHVPTDAERIDDVIMRELLCEETQLKDEAKLTEDLGADSLDITEMTIALEEEFELADYALQDEADNMETIGDVRKAVEKAIKARAKKRGG